MSALIKQPTQFLLSGATGTALVGTTTTREVPIGRYRLTTNAPVVVHDGSTTATLDGDLVVLPEWSPFELELTEGAVSLAAVGGAAARAWLVPVE